MILIAGGTGRLGSLLVARLTARGQPVRVMTRDPARHRPMGGGLIEVVPGDVRDPAALALAAAGTEVVVSAMHGFPGDRKQNPASIDRDGNINLADAARSAGADLVLMSVVGASATHPLELFRMKYAAEAHARSVGLPLTVVRATAYLEMWIEILQRTAGRSRRPLVFGAGDNPINFVSARDVAAVVDRALTDPSARGRTLQVCGPQALTFNALAAAVQTAAGRDDPPRHLPRALLAVAANTVGLAQPAIRRQIQAALVMDRIDLAAGPSVLPEDYPHPGTTLEDCLSQLSGRSEEPGSISR